MHQFWKVLEGFGRFWKVFGSHQLFFFFLGAGGATPASMSSSDCTTTSSSSSPVEQGLTLVHFPAQLEPFLKPNTP